MTVTSGPNWTNYMRFINASAPLNPGQATKYSLTKLQSKAKDAKKAKSRKLDGHIPRVNQSEILIGQPVNVQYRQANADAQNRVYKAIKYVGKVLHVPTGMYRKTRLVAAAAVPKFTFSSLWSVPAYGTLTKLRTGVVKCIFGNSSLMRAPEVTLAVLNDPTQVEPSCAIHAYTLNTARRIIIKDVKRYRLFVQSMKSI